MSKDNASLQAKAHAKVWTFEAKAIGSEAKATDQDHNNLTLRPKGSLEDYSIFSVVEY